ncbi:hypothetical protein QUF86_01335 [Peribacillus sp. NJ11]|uniref:hypothetical protein n=1 Tax=Peribacillus sp. NJ11 TaxID=3055861 RepID=UPI0025A30215|nr:hypothetical protein [Peribacillus sp. NJ11]MDM5219479.1 hypothetical protein [Peribacillus sp. NJ11]
MRNEIDFIDGFNIGIELEKLIDPRKKPGWIFFKSQMKSISLASIPILFRNGLMIKQITLF